MRWSKSILTLPYALKGRDGHLYTLHELVQNGPTEALEKLCLDNLTEFDRKLVMMASVFNGQEVHKKLVLLSNFSRFTLPVTRPDQNQTIWHSDNGDFSCVLSSGHAGGKTVGLPFGAKARLILLYINTEAYRSHTGEISLGNSLTDFMRRLGLGATGGKKGSITYLKDQAARLARSRFEFEWKNKNSIEDLTFADTQLWEFIEGQGYWPQTLSVSDTFRRSVRKHGFFLDDVAVSMLSGHPFVLDWYFFLAFNLKSTRSIYWDTLHKQLGRGITRYGDFRRKSLNALKLISAVYPSATLTADYGKLHLKQSAPIKEQLFGASSKLTHLPNLKEDFSHFHLLSNDNSAVNSG